MTRELERNIGRDRCSVGCARGTARSNAALRCGPALIQPRIASSASSFSPSKRVPSMTCFANPAGKTAPFKLARVGHRSINLLDVRRHGLLAQCDPTSQTQQRRVVVPYELKAPPNDRCKFAVDRQ